MAKRSTWSTKEVKIITQPIKDSEFTEILAYLGQLIYDELSSQPGSNISITQSIATNSVKSASALTRKKVVNE